MPEPNNNQTRMAELANEIFRNPDIARKWMSLPNPALRNHIPFEWAKTHAGALEVEAILTRIAYGVYI
jgi:uncharacterized protein (DUF2384 family)